MVEKKYSNHNNWKTPDWLYRLLNDKYNFNFDPCPLNNNPDFDGLKVDWGDSTFVNPPYGHQLKLFVKKAFDEWKKGKTVVMLLPVRTDTTYFHKYIYGYAKLIFIEGRLRFEGYGTKNNRNINNLDGLHFSNASFPTMLVIWEKERAKNPTQATLLGGRLISVKRESADSQNSPQIDTSSGRLAIYTFDVKG